MKLKKLVRFMVFGAAGAAIATMHDSPEWAAYCVAWLSGMIGQTYIE
jgi:hypothetical protein